MTSSRPGRLYETVHKQSCACSSLVLIYKSSNNDLCLLNSKHRLCRRDTITHPLRSLCLVSIICYSSQIFNSPSYPDLRVLTVVLTANISLILVLLDTRHSTRQYSRNTDSASKYCQSDFVVLFLHCICGAIWCHTYCCYTQSASVRDCPAEPGDTEHRQQW